MFTYTDILMLAIDRKQQRNSEDKFGIGNIPQSAKDILYAAALTRHQKGEIKTESLVKHPLVGNIARPTFYRYLQYLVKSGHLVSTRKGYYKFWR